MNKEQQTFVNEMLRHGDKTKAYRYAYPDAKSDKAVESSVNRLLKHPEVKQAIDEPTNRLKAEAKAEVEAELKERMKAELHPLAQVFRRVTCDILKTPGL